MIVDHGMDRGVKVALSLLDIEDDASRSREAIYTEPAI